MRISKKKLIVYLIVTILICFNLFVLKPILKKNYFSEDILDFERNSWKYTIGISLVLLIAFTVYAFKKNILNLKFIIYNFIVVFVFSFFGKASIDHALLYANLKIETKKYTKSYVVIRYAPNKVFHIYDNKSEFIVFEEQLKKIDSIRIKKKLKSLYNLKNNDTLNVDYKTGILNVKFLK
ncbi:hypothetical protein [Flavobacterium luminosum]|uniref:Uncharacterized protein n=1 Tax=Flavobacterium luminosum TaxID=2949086 RepID=A0ABT0TRJ2_9FLAO|nr:hypothetical protein [Flavobacterium sp. HXWNR70]MCL9810129.1 hypothetical protein [Flavobacterium sp. HXWNR70]